MAIILLWILYSLNAPFWVWFIAVISLSIHELNAIINLIDRFKKK